VDSLRHAFFEDPTYVYVFLAFAELALLAIWHERRGARWALALLAPIAAAGVVLAVSAMVVTDQEQIVLAVEEIAGDLEHGSVEAAERYLDDSFQGIGGSKQRAIEEGRTAIDRYRVRKIRLLHMTVEVQGKTAWMHVATVIDLADGRTALTWDVHWIKRPAGWRIREAPPPQMKLELL
jgi:hypothetical protein